MSRLAPWFVCVGDVVTLVVLRAVQARVAQAFGGAISRLKLKFEIHDLTDVKTIPKMEFVKALRSVAPGE